MGTLTKGFAQWCQSQIYHEFLKLLPVFDAHFTHIREFPVPLKN